MLLWGFPWCFIFFDALGCVVLYIVPKFFIVWFDWLCFTIFNTETFFEYILRNNVGRPIRSHPKRITAASCVSDLLAAFQIRSAWEREGEKKKECGESWERGREQKFGLKFTKFWVYWIPYKIISPGIFGFLQYSWIPKNIWIWSNFV